MTALLPAVSVLHAILPYATPCVCLGSAILHTFPLHDAAPLYAAQYSSTTRLAVLCTTVCPSALLQCLFALVTTDYTMSVAALLQLLASLKFSVCTILHSQTACSPSPPLHGAASPQEDVAEQQALQGKARIAKHPVLPQQQPSVFGGTEQGGNVRAGLAQQQQESDLCQRLVSAAQIAEYGGVSAYMASLHTGSLTL